MNKILFFLIICFLIFPISLGNTEEGIIINGNDWQQWPTSSKISFVQGWAKCGQTAANSLIIPVKNWNESVKSAQVQVDSFKNEGVLLGGVTIGQIIETISGIYSDPRVKTLDISEIMPFVSGRLIQGWTAKEIDEVIAFKVKLKQCEQEKEKFAEECNSLRRKNNSYLENLRKK